MGLHLARPTEATCPSETGPEAPAWKHLRLTDLHLPAAATGQHRPESPKAVREWGEQRTRKGLGEVNVDLPPGRRGTF